MTEIDKLKLKNHVLEKKIELVIKGLEMYKEKAQKAGLGTQTIETLLEVLKE